jgi:hypothetical protein
MHTNRQDEENKSKIRELGEREKSKFIFTHVIDEENMCKL